MQIIHNAHADYKRANRSAMVEAAKSVGQTLGLLAGTVALGAGALWYVAKEGRANPAIATAGLLGTTVAGGLTLLRSIDAKQDLDLWLHLNSGERRAQFTTGMFTAQAEAMTRLSTVWADNAIASNAWQLQQWQQAQTPRPMARTVEAEAVEVATVPELAASQDIALDLATTPKSALIVGQPGSGKGLSVAHATRHLKFLHPEITIWVIDPKADPNEAAYWNACDRVCDTVLPAFATEAQIDNFQIEVESFIECFKVVPGRKLLIFDEALAVKELMPKWFKGIMAGFNHLCSTGRSKGVYGWLMSQTPNADDFGISGGARNVYRRVLLLSADDLGLIANRSTFFSGVPSEQQLQQTGRVFFDSLGNRWGVVPHYREISEPAVERNHNGKAKSRHDQLERLFNAEATKPAHEDLYHSEPALTSNARTVLKYLRRNGPIIEGDRLANNLSGKPYRLNRQETRAALDELKAANAIDLRDGIVALNPNFKGI